MPARIFVGAQWGDEGKGKIVDFYASRAHMCVRFNGGNNAGHTIYDDSGKSIALHLVPAGIRHEKDCVIGPAVAVHFKSLLEEIGYLRGIGSSCEKLMIIPEAHLVMPWHIALDWCRENERGKSGGDSIGTTLRGIGPCFEDKAARKYAFRMADLKNKEKFLARLERVYREKFIRLVAEERGMEAINNRKLFPDFDKLRAYFSENIERILPYVNDNALKLIRKSLEEGRQVDFEGAQGTLLDVDHGTYPYVTGANTTAKAAFDLISVSRRDVRVIGIAKAYPTRVGFGPFPTEIAGSLQERLRELGQEYGATTGRPRRCGWFDAKLLRYASRVNGGFDEFVLTKLDILGLINEPVLLAVGYKNDSLAMSRLEEAIPVYEEFESWGEVDGACLKFKEDLPEKATKYIFRIEELTRLQIGVISIGAERKAIVT